MKYLEKYCLITKIILTFKKYPSIQSFPSTVQTLLYEVLKIDFIRGYEKKFEML